MYANLINFSNKFLQCLKRNFEFFSFLIKLFKQSNNKVINFLLVFLYSITNIILLIISSNNFSSSNKKFLISVIITKHLLIVIATILFN